MIRPAPGAPGGQLRRGRGCLLLMAIGGVALLVVALLLLLVDRVRSSGHRQVELDLPRVEARVVTAFPVTGRYLDLISYCFWHPRIAFDPLSERIVFAVQLDLLIAGHRLLGRTDGSGTLRFDAVRGRLLLDRLQVGPLLISGLSGDLVQHLQEPLRQALSERLVALVLYQDASDLGQDRPESVWTIRGIRVEGQRMTVTLGR